MSALLGASLMLSPLDRTGWTCEGDRCARSAEVAGYPAMEVAQESCGVVDFHSVSWMFVPEGLETGDAVRFEVPDVSKALDAHWKSLVDVYDRPGWEFRVMPGMNVPGEYILLGAFGPDAYVQMETRWFENGAAHVVHTVTPLEADLPHCPVEAPRAPEPVFAERPALTPAESWPRFQRDAEKVLEPCHGQLEKDLGRHILVWAYTDRQYPRWVDADPGIPLKEPPLYYAPEKFLFAALELDASGRVTRVSAARPHEEPRADEAMATFWACVQPAFDEVVFEQGPGTVELTLKPYSNLGWIVAE